MGWAPQYKLIQKEEGMNDPKNKKWGGLLNIN